MPTMIASQAHARLVWSVLARRWASIRPPFRPSSGELDVYRRHLSGLGGEAMLLLGSTPELRDLAASLGIARVTMVDISRSMATAMDRFMIAPERDHEVRVIDDWGRMEFPAGSFRAVVGDLVWHWLGASRQAIVRDKIHRFLGPGGLFISRFRLREGPLGLRRVAGGSGLLRLAMTRAMSLSLDVTQTRAGILERFGEGFTLIEEANPGVLPILVFRRET